MWKYVALSSLKVSHGRVPFFISKTTRNDRSRTPLAHNSEKNIIHFDINLMHHYWQFLSSIIFIFILHTSQCQDHTLTNLRYVIGSFFSTLSIASHCFASVRVYSIVCGCLRSRLIDLLVENYLSIDHSNYRRIFFLMFV